jgi:excisionase family DNA binding protein
LQERKKQLETAPNLTYSIPEAGAMVGLSRNGSYDAAERGEIPFIRFGRKRRVPKAVWDRKLGLIPEAGQ